METNNINRELLEILKEAMDSRAPDLADAEHPGWYGRASAAIAKAEGVSEFGQ